MANYKLTDRHDIIDWLRYHAEDNLLDEDAFIIREDGSVDYYGDLRLRTKTITDDYDCEELPFKFGTVHGNFVMKMFRGLTTLKGLPRIVKGDLYLIHCSAITNMEHGPVEVEGDCVLDDCTQITSLKGCPKALSLTCLTPGLTSLEGLTDVNELQVGFHSNIKDWSQLPTSISTLYVSEACSDIPILPKLEKFSVVKDIKPFPANTTRWLLQQQPVIAVDDLYIDEELSPWLKLLTTADILERACLFEALYHEPYVGGIAPAATPELEF